MKTFFKIQHVHKNFDQESIAIENNKKISLTVPQTRRQDRPQEATQASSESEVHAQGLGSEGNCG